MPPSRTSTIGFIGLGTMGLPMARRLAAAGTPLCVWNRTPLDRSVFRPGSTVEIHPRPREVLRSTDIAILMLRDQAATDAALERGTEAFIGNVTGTTIISMSAVDPLYSCELADDIARTDGRFLEAPVSGTRITAEAGQLTCFLGGAPSLAKSVAPLLSQMCCEQTHCGGIGDGLRMKLATDWPSLEMRRKVGLGWLRAKPKRSTACASMSLKARWNEA